MATTLANLRIKVNEVLGDRRTGTFTTSSATVPADTSLADVPDDFYNGWYLMPTAGTYIGVVRKVQDFTKSGGVITVEVAFAGATGSVAYQLTRFDPRDITDAINEAVTKLYPSLWVPQTDEWSLITNNIIPNSHPADWASASVPDKWNVSGLTASKETGAANRRFGPNSMKLVAATGQYVQCREQENKYLHDLAGIEITLKAWVWADTASRIRIGIYDTAWSYSSYHAGDSKWHLVTLSDNFAKDPSQNALAVAYHNTGGSATAYVQNMRLIGPYVQRYLLPTDFKDLQQVWMQTGGNLQFSGDSLLGTCDAIHENITFARLFNWNVEYDGTDRWLIFPYYLPGERRLKLIGSKYGSSLSAETDSVEFDEPQTDAIAAQTAAIMFKKIANNTAIKNFKRYEDLALKWEVETERLKRRYDLPMESVSLKMWQL